MKNKDLLNYLKTLPLDRDIKIYANCECGYSGVVENVMCAFTEDDITYLCTDEDGIEACISRLSHVRDKITSFNS